MDALVRCLQSTLAEITAVRFCPLSVRMGMEGLPRGRLRMAKVIQFYRPSNFKNDAKIASQERGKVIEFSVPPKKSA